MNSSESSPRRADKTSYNPVTPYDMFYQLTYMSAMASAGISRSKTFEIAAQSKYPAAKYFVAVNTLVAEFRYDYPDACRIIGLQAKSENIRSFMLRMSDALRSGEPINEFLVREADVQGEDYRNEFERKLENLKQWTNAFTSIIISIGLIIIIQMITSMIYSTSVTTTGIMVMGAALMAICGVFIIYRIAPHEAYNMPPSKGSKEQRRALQMFKIFVPVTILAFGVTLAFVDLGVALLVAAACMLPIGITSLISDRSITRKDVEFSTLLRSMGGMATSSGTTLKQALTKIDLSSFPALEADVERLSTRLLARVEPDVCWSQFGTETGSSLIKELVGIFYGAVKIGGDPERVGYVCSLFASKATQLRAKRRLVSGTFSALGIIMHAMVAALMVFVLSIVNNFAALVMTLAPSQAATAATGNIDMSLGLAEFTPEDLGLLAAIMVITVAIASAAAIIFSDGGLKLKMFLYLSITTCIAGVTFVLVPPLVTGILAR